MPKYIGRQVNVGMAVEFTAGTQKTATIFPKWLEWTMQPMSEKALFEGARGQRNKYSDSRIRRKHGGGSIKVVPDVEVAPYFFYGALGSLSSDTASGETTVYEHTITVNDANASMPTFTMYSEEGSIVTERFAGTVVDTLNLEVSDSYAEMTCELIGMYPASGSITESFEDEYLFAYDDMTVKFGTTLSNADGASATPLKGFTLNINNNTQVDEAFLSGSNEAQAGYFIAGPLEVTGTYTLHFEDTTELNKYKNNTVNAAVVSFTGNSIGNAETEEIQIRLGGLALTEAPKQMPIDGVLVLQQGFTLQTDSSDGDITVIITNENDGDDYAPAS